MSRSAPAALPAALPNPGRYGAGQPTEALSDQIGNEPHVIPASTQHHAMLLSDRTAGLTAPVSHLKKSDIVRNCVSFDDALLSVFQALTSANFRA